MKRKHKSNIPSFIPNQPGAWWLGIDQGKRSQEEARKNKENQKKLALKKGRL